MKNPEIRRFLERPGGLAALLVQTRTAANLSMRALGEKVGWQSSRISKLETGQQLPSRSDITTFAAGCNVSEKQLADLLAAWDEFNQAFPPIAGRARRQSAAFNSSDEGYAAGYAQGYADALQDAQQKLSNWIDELQDDPHT